MPPEPLRPMALAKTFYEYARFLQVSTTGQAGLTIASCLVSVEARLRLPFSVRLTISRQLDQYDPMVVRNIKET